VWRIVVGVCEHVLAGHTSDVWCVSISGDGSRVVTGSADARARVWRIVDGACEHVLAGHTNTVQCVSISGDGSLAATSTSRSTCVWSSGSLVKLVSWGDDVVQCELRSADAILVRFAHAWPQVWYWRDTTEARAVAPIPASLRALTCDGPLASRPPFCNRQAAVLSNGAVLARGGFEAGWLRRAVISATFADSPHHSPTDMLRSSLSADRGWEAGALQWLPDAVRTGQPRVGDDVERRFGLHPLAFRELGCLKALSAHLFLVVADSVHATVGPDGPVALRLVASLLPHVRGRGSGWSNTDCFVGSPTANAADVARFAAAHGVLVASLESVPLAAEKEVASACAKHFSHVLVVRPPVGCDLVVWRPLLARAARNRARLVRAVVEAETLRRRGAGFAPRDGDSLGWVADAAPLCAVLSQLGEHEFDAVRVAARCGDALRDVAHNENDWIQPRATAVASCSLCGLGFSVIVRKVRRMSCPAVLRSRHPMTHHIPPPMQHHCRSCGCLLCSRCCPKPSTRGALRQCLVCLL